MRAPHSTGKAKCVLTLVTLLMVLHTLQQERMTYAQALTAGLGRGHGQSSQVIKLSFTNDEPDDLLLKSSGSRARGPPILFVQKVSTTLVRVTVTVSILKIATAAIFILEEDLVDNVTEWQSTLQASTSIVDVMIWKSYQFVHGMFAPPTQQMLAISNGSIHDTTSKPSPKAKARAESRARKAAKKSHQLKVESSKLASAAHGAGVTKDEENSIDVQVSEINDTGILKQMFVKTLKGKTKVFNVDLNVTVRTLKDLIQAKEGVPASDQRLTCGGQNLQDSYKLAQCNIAAESTIFLLLRMRGGSQSSHENMAIDDGDAESW